MMRRWERWENTPLHCCECGAFIDMVSEENHGYIGSYTLCDACHQIDLAKHFRPCDACLTERGAAQNTARRITGWNL